MKDAVSSVDARRRNGGLSASAFVDVTLMAETDGRRSELRREIVLSRSIFRRRGEGVFGESPRFSVCSPVV